MLVGDRVAAFDTAPTLDAKLVLPPVEAGAPAPAVVKPVAGVKAGREQLQRQSVQDETWGLGLETR